MDLKNISKYLSFILRHQPESIGLKLSDEGWADINELIEKTAFSVGARYGKPILLKVDSKQMHADGFDFFKTESNVWLVDHVPAKYLTNIGDSVDR